MKMATLIEYSDALTDYFTLEYQLASQDITDIFKKDLEFMASSHGVTMESFLVEFTQSGSIRRKRRSFSTDAALTAVYSVPALVSADLAKLENDMFESTMTTVHTAISNAGGTFISTDAEVSISVVATGAALQETTPPINESPTVCPSAQCWTYDEQTHTCSMTSETCASLSCGATGFEITFDSALFNLEDHQAPPPFAGGLSPTWNGNKWSLNAPLEDTQMSYTIDTVLNA